MKNRSFKFNKLKFIIFLAIFFSSFLFKFVNISRDSLSWDEFYAYLTATLNFKDSLQLYYVGAEDNPPLYFLVLRIITSLFGPSETIIRSFSAISVSLCSSLIFLLIFEKTKNLLLSLMASFTFVLSPISEYYAHLCRPYAFLAFLFLLAFYFSHRFFEKEEKLSYCFFILCSSLMLYTHYYSIFMIASIFIALLLFSNNKFKVLFKEIIAAFVILILWSPWLATVIHQFNRVKIKYWIPKPTIKNIYEVFDIHLQVAIPVLLTFFLLFFLKENKKFILYSFSIIFLTLLLSFTYSLMVIPVFISKRIAILLLPILVIFIFITIYNSFLMNYLKIIFIFAILSISALNFFKYNSSYPHLEDWKSSIKFLSASITGNEKIIYPIKFHPPIAEYYNNDLIKYISSAPNNNSFWLITPPFYFSSKLLQNYFGNYALVEEYNVFKKLQSPIWHFKPQGKTFWKPKKEEDNHTIRILLSPSCYILRGRIHTNRTIPISVYLYEKNILSTVPIKKAYVGPFSFCTNSKEVRLYLSSSEAELEWISFSLNDESVKH